MKSGRPVSGFDVTHYWDEPASLLGEWWVYVLVHAAGDQPAYIGMTGDLPGRLRKHRRYWVGPGFATVYRLPSADAARRLEAALISMHPASGNIARPTLSWVERQHFDGLRLRWAAGLISPCSSCGAVCDTETQMGWSAPLTEPDARCEANHLSIIEMVDVLTAVPAEEAAGRLDQGMVQALVAWTEEALVAAREYETTWND